MTDQNVELPPELEAQLRRQYGPFADEMIAAMIKSVQTGEPVMAGKGADGKPIVVVSQEG